MNCLQIDEYRARLLEVLEVTGQLKKSDLDICYEYTTGNEPQKQRYYITNRND